MDTLAPLFASIEEADDRPVLVTFETGKQETLSGREFTHAVESEASRLIRDLGAGPDRRFAVFAAPSARSVIASLAVLRSGATLVPVDTQFTDETLTSVLDDADLAAVWCDSRRCSRLKALRPDLARLPVEAPAPDAGGDSEFPARTPENPAALFYTSGTTGPPKGVPLSERNLAYQFDVLKNSGLVGPGDRLLLPLPLHHVYPLVIGVLVPLALGLSVVLPRSLTGREVLHAAAESGATVMIGVPRLYRALLEGLERRGGVLLKVAGEICYRIRSTTGISAGRLLLAPVHRRVGPQLRLFASGGAPLSPETALRLEGLGWDVAIGYGLTETSPLLTINQGRSPHPESVGSALPGTDLRVTEGELQARGPGVFAGYRHLPDKSREAFAEGGWFRTGDLARIDEEGYVYITGRASTVLVTEGGKNIQPDEVETAYESHPAIREIAVLQKESRLVAVVVPESAALHDGGDSEEVLRGAINRISGQLPSYQRIADFAITREPLPRTRLGKLRRHLLQERYRQAREGLAEPVARPMTPEEMPDADLALLDSDQARQVWELLTERYPDRRLTPDANLQLDLGIDSMEWLDLGLEISRRTGVELDESQTSALESVRDLLELMTETESSTPMGEQRSTPQRVLTRRDQHWLQPLSPPGAALAGFLHRIDRMVAERWFDLSVEGAPPPPAQVLFAPNHISHLDPFMLAAALGPEQMRRTFWAGWTGAAFRNPFTRVIARLGQAIPVDQRSARTSLALAEAVLKRGYNLVWFPEGVRSRNGRMQPFRKGVGHLLDHTPVTVLPVVVRGTYEAMPPDRKLPRRHPVQLCFASPVEVDQLDREGTGDQRPERITQALQQRMRKLLQEE
ncbi:AMP-binding protein [Thiohalomonas denitrificans]|uniref:Long-chain acyl-CoA synthetase n=1 Tax=Thiohalomonas denitrificans TaxID=415747 RepID=A0A1G5Q176_9GAMM|nr:AMP-binding protein [Thiohalomonas denitrificans]SCZ55604.1 long-chain acyl-CoA synthetase [Thiohalomonas denitrificans]